MRTAQEQNETHGALMVLLRLSAVWTTAITSAVNTEQWYYNSPPALEGTCSHARFLERLNASGAPMSWGIYLAVCGHTVSVHLTLTHMWRQAGACTQPANAKRHEDR
jgi:hypothetical protein